MQPTWPARPGQRAHKVGRARAEGPAPQLFWQVAAGANRGLPLVLATVAEISRAAGYFPPVGDDSRPRDVELLHEAAFLTHDLMVYRSCPVTDPAQPWDYELRDPVDAEAVFLAQPYSAMKKMALARAVQRDNDLSDRARDRIYSTLTVAEILAVLAGTRAVPPDPGGSLIKVP